MMLEKENFENQENTDDSFEKGTQHAAKKKKRSNSII